MNCEFTLWPDQCSSGSCRIGSSSHCRACIPMNSRLIHDEEILEDMNLRTGDMKQNEFQVILDKHPDKSRIYI